MSMNLNISAKKDSETHFDKKGKPHKETKDLVVIQTPTKVSYWLMEQENILEAYCDWAREQGMASHAKKLKKEIGALIANGYEINYYVM